MAFHQILTAIKNKNGFTIIEVIASVAIFSMLSTLVFVAFQHYEARTKGRKKTYTHNLLNRLVTQYYKDHLNYPTETQLIDLIKRIYPKQEDINTLKNEKCLQEADPLTSLSQLGWQADNSNKVSIILDACP